MKVHSAFLLQVPRRQMKMTSTGVTARMI